MILCLAANPSVDRLFEVERLVKGDIHRPSSFVQVAGGKGFNVARAARALGADVCAVALLRGHNGRWLQEALAAEGVEGEFVWTHGENRSSLSVADRETAGLTEFYEHGAVAPDAAWVELTHAAVTRCSPGSWLTISGSMPRGAPDEGYRDLVREVRDAGVRVALDAEGERLRAALTAGPDVVKVNVAEAGELLGVPTARRDDSLAAASKIRDMAGGDGHAGIVTRGSQGVMLAAPDGTLYEGVLYVRGRYPVGSGDSFLAGLVTALDGGKGWEDALRVALGAGAANAELPGAAKLDPSRAGALAEQADVHLLSMGMARVERLGEDDWAVFRELRLRSLRESPEAFGSTYGEESSQPERAWRDWAAGRWRGGTAAVFAGRVDDGTAVGTATGAEYDAEPRVAHVYAMWVAPDARGAGVGRALLEAVEGWARARGSDRLVLSVTESNETARRFYEECGFVDTGGRETLREGSHTQTLILSKSL